MVKIGDIARATGYSTTTVSKALNNYTDISETAREKIKACAIEMGYIPNAQARGLVMKRSFTIGVMLDELLGLGINHPFFAGVIQSFREAVESHGYSLIFISNQLGNSNIESYYDHCRQRNVDGVFILCTNYKEESIQQLIKCSIPTVLFDMSTPEANCVISNHYQGAFDAVNYLVDLGHTKIAHIYGSELTFAGHERRRAFQDAMKYHDLNIHENYEVSGGYFDFKYGKKAMEELIALEDFPTAVFAGSDIIALGAIQACYEHKISIPQDLSIIGFDNVKLLDWITPALTTVAQDTKSLGEACCDMLVDVITNKKTTYMKKIIKTYIVERESCKSVNL